MNTRKRERDRERQQDIRRNGEQFTMTCVSHGKDELQLYPNNTLEEFTVPAPSNVSLDKWQVAVKSVVIPSIKDHIEKCANQVWMYCNCLNNRHRRPAFISINTSNINSIRDFMDAIKLELQRVDVYYYSALKFFITQGSIANNLISEDIDNLIELDSLAVKHDPNYFDQTGHIQLLFSKNFLHLIGWGKRMMKPNTTEEYNILSPIITNTSGEHILSQNVFKKYQTIETMIDKIFESGLPYFSSPTFSILRSNLVKNVTRPGDEGKFGIFEMIKLPSAIESKFYETKYLTFVDIDQYNYNDFKFKFTEVDSDKTSFIFSRHIYNKIERKLYYWRDPPLKPTTNEDDVSMTTFDNTLNRLKEKSLLKPANPEPGVIINLCFRRK